MVVNKCRDGSWVKVSISLTLKIPYNETLLLMYARSLMLDINGSY